MPVVDLRMAGLPVVIPVKFGKDSQLPSVEAPMIETLAADCVKSDEIISEIRTAAGAATVGEVRIEG